MPGRVKVAARRWSFVILAGACLLVSHDAIFAVELGPGELLARVLRHAGHGYWPIASAVLGLLGAALAVGATLRIWRLGRAARRLPGTTGEAPAGATYVTRALKLWIRLLPLVAAAFLVQENLEHLASHGHMPGLAILVGPEHPLALPVLAAISAFASAIGGLVAAREASLLARLREAAKHPRRDVRRQLRARRGCAAPRLGVMASALAGRAPPQDVLIPTF